jgi:hypothetical protein
MNELRSPLRIAPLTRDGSGEPYEHPHKSSLKKRAGVKGE